VGCGSGFDAFAEVLRERYEGCVERILPGLFPHAREVATLAVSVVAAGLAVAAEHAMPVYVRDKVALKTAER
jgi:tRNA threonylcarbamoyladenosine biosynthesis protein TsaB